METPETPRTLTLRTRPQVLFLDSDSLPLLDPSLAFDTPEYRRHGNLFFPDYWTRLFGVWEAEERRWVPERLYQALGLASPWASGPGANETVHQTESGQLLLDRHAPLASASARGLPALWLQSV